MVMGILSLLPICFLVYRKIIPIPVFVSVLFTFYWLPKCISVKVLNKLYPNILTHRINVNYSVSNNVNNDVNNMNSKKKQISLTFDDVPYGGVDSITKIISLLNLYGMRGTFFVISGDVDANSRKILVDAVKNGHQLGNHGKRNIMHFALSEQSLIEEIED